MKGADIEVLRTKAASIRQHLEKIRQYASLPEEKFWSDERNIGVVKLWFIQMIQDAADMCNHLVARLAARAPSGYPECFEVLAEIHVLDADLAERLKRMARFRNLLIHRYWEVDDHRVLYHAQQDLSDLEAFLQAVGNYLSQQL